MSQRSWGKVIAQIQQSGLDIQKRNSRENKERYEFLQRDLLQQMKKVKNKKQQELLSKQIQRNKIQTADKESLQQKLKQKQKLRQKQLKFRQQNYILLQQKLVLDRKNSQKNIIPSQSPIIEHFYTNSRQKQKKSKDLLKECNQININLMNQNTKNRTKIKNQSDQKGQEFKNYVEKTFQKIQSDRFRFKKSCLQGGYLRSNSQRYSTQPDSLQKEYSSYLQQQIGDKIERRQSINIYRNRSQVQNDDKIRDQNIGKINHDVGKQTSSPAYLGRLPNSYDRQKQLNCISKQLFRDKRLKTQSLPLSQSEQIKEYKKQPQIISNTYNKIQKNQAKPIEMKNLQMKTNQKKYFKQYNILTGKMIVNEHPVNFL